MKKRVFLLSAIEYRRYWTVVGVILLSTLLLEVAGVAAFMRGGVQRLLTPVSMVAATTVRVIRWPYDVSRTAVNSYNRIKDLELRYDEALAQIAEAEAIKKENQSLREALGGGGSSESTHFQQTVATIIGYGQPLIDRSNTQIIENGAMVLIGDTLIGRVGNVSEGQAEVVLFSRNASSGVLAQTTSGVAGIVSGDGRQIFLTELPIEASIQEGEQVVTVGQPGIQPGILIGKIRSIKTLANEPTRRALIDQHVSFYESRVVQVRK